MLISGNLNPYTLFELIMDSRLDGRTRETMVMLVGTIGDRMLETYNIAGRTMLIARIQFLMASCRHMATLWSTLA